MRTDRFFQATRPLAMWVIALHFVAALVIVGPMAAASGSPEADAGVERAEEVLPLGSEDPAAQLSAPPSTAAATTVPAAPAPTTAPEPAPAAAPAPTTSTAPPPPPPPTPPAPAPAPTSTSTSTSTAPPPPAAEPTEAPEESLEARLERAFATGVPQAWRSAIDVHLEVIDGSTSWANGNGTISIARSHASGKFEHLVDIVAHEFGHLIAFEYGSGEYVGAGPEGWPAPPERPEEAWADCVQTSFTGREYPSHGLQPCRGEQLSWAQNWLAAGPPSS